MSLDEVLQKEKEERWLQKMERDQKNFDTTRSIYNSMCELDVSRYGPEDLVRYKTRLETVKKKMIEYQIALVRTGKGLDIL